MAELRDIGLLEPWPDNYNSGDVGRIVVSILTFGYNDTLRIWKDPENPDHELIMAGNHSHQGLVQIAQTGPKILKQLDLVGHPWPPAHVIEKQSDDGSVSWYVDTIDVNHLSYDEASAYAIADNEIARKSARDDTRLAEHLINLAKKNQKAFRGTGFDADEVSWLVQTLAAQGDLPDNTEDADGLPPVRLTIVVKDITKTVEIAHSLRELLNEHPDWGADIQ